MSKTLEELRDELEEKQTRLTELENGDNEQEYDDMLDEEPVTVAGISFCASRILKELDPIAYSCGLDDYNDYEISQLESEISDLEDEIKELENEITEPALGSIE